MNRYKDIHISRLRACLLESIMMEFRIKEFPIDNIPISCSWIVIGGPGTGKTSLVKDIAYTHKDRYPVAKIHSGTEDSNQSYEETFPKLFITDGFDEDQEKDHILRQKRCKINGCMNGAAINIVDDCSDKPSIYRSPTFKGLYKNGSRHWNQLFITGLQYGVDFLPDIRKSASYIALFFEPDQNEREKLYRNFGGPCGSFDEFQDIMDQMILPEPGREPRRTDIHTCMIIKRLDIGPKRENNVFYYKARLHKGFKFGCREYREWDSTRRDAKKSTFSGI